MDALAKTTSLTDCTSFLRVPPFPGAKQQAFLVCADSTSAPDEAEMDRLIDRMAELRVGSVDVYVIHQSREGW